MSVAARSSVSTRIGSLSQRPEVVSVVLLGLAILFSARLSPYFLTLTNLQGMISQFMEEGVIALAMTLIIISGNIDLSVGSIVGLVSLGFGLRYAAGWPVPVDIIIALSLGAVLGAINGLLITRLRLPSLVVTLGTLALFRGIAQVLLGDSQISGYPTWFVGIDQRLVVGVPLPLIIFLLFSVLFGLLLHRTVLGRLVYAIGGNEEACRFSAIAVDTIKLLLFVLSGLMSAVAALMLTSRLASSRWDFGMGFELDVITAVLLGGTDIFGGRGSILGTVIAVFIVSVIRNGMGLGGYNGEEQSMGVGALLILSILLPIVLHQLARVPVMTGFGGKEVRRQYENSKVGYQGKSVGQEESILATTISDEEER
jgi:rhamnose transport system permease protein